MGEGYGVNAVNDLLRNSLQPRRSVTLGTRRSSGFVTLEQEADRERREDDERQLRAIALQRLSSTLSYASTHDTGPTETLEVRTDTSQPSSLNSQTLKGPRRGG